MSGPKDFQVGKHCWCRDSQGPFVIILKVVYISPQGVTGTCVNTESGESGSGEGFHYENVDLSREVTDQDILNAKARAFRVFNALMGDFSSGL